MKNTNNDNITDAMINKASIIHIISGEGGSGTTEVYKGAKTAMAVKARLTRERAGGDRWSILEIGGNRID